MNQQEYNKMVRKQREQVSVDIVCSPYGIGSAMVLSSAGNDLQLANGAYNLGYIPEISVLGKPSEFASVDEIFSVTQDLSPRGSFKRLCSAFMDAVGVSGDYKHVYDLLKTQSNRLFTLNDGENDALSSMAKAALRENMVANYIHDLDVAVETGSGEVESFKCNVCIISPLYSINSARDMVRHWAMSEVCQQSSQGNLDFGKAVAYQADPNNHKPIKSVAWYDSRSQVFVTIDAAIGRNMRKALGVDEPRANYWPKCMRLNMPS